MHSKAKKQKKTLEKKPNILNVEYFLQKINKKYREKNESWQIPEKTKHDDKKDAPPIDITWLIAQEVDSVKAE